MCNAWNHSPGCSCGWGGGWKGGSLFSSTKSIPTPIRTVHGFSNQYSDSYTNPNARCPVCGASVFFYRSPSDGKVYFDELGPPWPKHPCTDNSISQSTGSPKKSFLGDGSNPVYRLEIIPSSTGIFQFKGQTNLGLVKLYFPGIPIDEKAPYFLIKAEKAGDYVVSTLSCSGESGKVTPVNFMATESLDRAIEDYLDQSDSTLIKVNLESEFLRKELFRRFPSLYSGGPFAPDVGKSVHVEMNHLSLDGINRFFQELRETDKHRVLTVISVTYLQLVQSATDLPQPISLSEKRAAAQSLGTKWKSVTTPSQARQVESFLRFRCKSGNQIGKGKILRKNPNKSVNPLKNKDREPIDFNKGKEEKPQTLKPVQLDPSLISSALNTITDRFPTLRSTPPINSDIEGQLKLKIRTIASDYLNAAFRLYRSTDKYHVALICAEHYENPLSQKKSGQITISLTSKQDSAARLTKHWKISANANQIPLVERFLKEHGATLIFSTSSKTE